MLLLWSAGCAAYVWAVASRPGHLGHVELSVLWMYWQPALPPLLMLWLWGAAVRRMTQLAVDYEQCFAAKDRKYLLDGAEVQKVRRRGQLVTTGPQLMAPGKGGRARLERAARFCRQGPAQQGKGQQHALRRPLQQAASHE